MFSELTWYTNISSYSHRSNICFFPILCIFNFPVLFISGPWLSYLPQLLSLCALDHFSVYIKSMNKAHCSKLCPLRRFSLFFSVVTLSGTVVWQLSIFRLHLADPCMNHACIFLLPPLVSHKEFLIRHKSLSPHPHSYHIPYYHNDVTSWCYRMADVPSYCLLLAVVWLKTDPVPQSFSEGQIPRINFLKLGCPRGQSWVKELSLGGFIWKVILEFTRRGIEKLDKESNPGVLLKHAVTIGQWSSVTLWFVGSCEEDGIFILKHR